MILTSFDDEALFAAVMAGASGYLLKQIGGSSLVDGIRQVAAGRSLVDPAVTRKLLERIRHPVEPDPVAGSLTAREREILSLIADGYTNRQIGERLFLAEKTVKNYVSALLAKLGMQRRTQAAVYGASLKSRPNAEGIPSLARTTAPRPDIVDRSALARPVPSGDGGASTVRKKAQL